MVIDTLASNSLKSSCVERDLNLNFFTVLV